MFGTCGCSELEECLSKDGRFLAKKICTEQSIDLLGTKDVHDWDGSRDGFEGEKRSHGDHSGSAVLHLDTLVAFVLLGGKLLLHTEVVEVQVTRDLGGLASEVVAGMSNRLTLSDSDSEQNSSEPCRLLNGEGSKSLGPVSIIWESWEMHSKASSTLHSKRTKSDYVQNVDMKHNNNE
jgi:hypothetical protein